MNGASTDLKIVFAGPMGAGKTTAIDSISTIATLKTEAANSDLEQSSKRETTVALDYGEVALRDGLTLKLFGTPGQARFDFMWASIAGGAMGLVLLLDHARPDPLDDLATYLKGFEELVRTGCLVVGVGRMESDRAPSLEDYINTASDLGFPAPVVAVDVREESDVKFLLDILLNQIEFAHCAEEIRGHL